MFTIEFITVLLLFYVLVSWSQGIWDISPWPGIEPTHPASEGEVLLLDHQRNPYIFKIRFILQFNKNGSFLKMI